MSMMLRFIAGFVGLLTAILWFFVIFYGSIRALILVGLLSVVSFILGGAVFLSEKWFPTALHCPSCDLQLDKFGGVGNECPQCQVKLRGTAEDLQQAYADESQGEFQAASAGPGEELVGV